MANKPKNRRNHKEERQLRIREVRRSSPDIKKISRALIALAVAEAEQQAQVQHQTPTDEVTTAGAAPEVRSDE